jgi:hypothetical protein
MRSLFRRAFDAIILLSLLAGCRPVEPPKPVPIASVPVEDIDAIAARPSEVPAARTTTADRPEIETSDPSKTVHVRGYMRRDGVYVRSHMRRPRK